ncbi:MAG: DUF938 domain-containing protein [Blastomonas sp.]
MSDSSPWFADAAGPEPKRHAPATLRNRDAILDVLREELPQSGMVLELASGSGEHIVHFARALPGLEWQPSDISAEACASADAWREAEGLANVRSPLMIDSMASAWPVERADAMLCINMVHIAPWEAAIGTFAGAASILPGDAPLIFYGPYLRPDVETAPSNLAFDANLRGRDSRWGLRDLDAMDALGAEHGFARTRLVEMPANNLTLVYRRQ